MNTKEELIRLWFDMWLRGEDFGIRDIFAQDAAYTESWGPVYHGVEKICRWFREWLTRGRVLAWDIHGFFHAGNRTAVTWFFQCRMGDEKPVGFEGVSVVLWTEDGKIASLTEYCCEPGQYDPYQDGPEPVFDTKGNALYSGFAGGAASKDREAAILRLWQAIAEQDEVKLAQFFTVDAQIVWPNTDECFDLPAYLRANCDYPGQWSGKVEKVAPDGSYSVARVWSPENGTARSVAFYQWRNGKIKQMTEYWGDTGPAPGWRAGLGSPVMEKI